MKKVIAEICPITQKVNLKVIHKDDGSYAGFVTVICDDLIEREKVRKEICKQMRHLKLTNLPSDDCKELEYYDADNIYDTLGVDTDNQFDYSASDKNELLLELIGDYLVK